MSVFLCVHLCTVLALHRYVYRPWYLCGCYIGVGRDSISSKLKPSTASL